MRQCKWIQCLAVAAALAAGSAAHAQGAAFPNKPVRLIIAFTPGSSTDIIGRAVAAKLSEFWGQPVVAENRAGAGGSIGSAAVVQSAARRLHAARQLVGARGEPVDLRHAAVRHAQGLRQPRAARRRAERAHRGAESRLEDARRFRRRGEGASPAQLNFSSAGVGSGTHFNLEKLKLMAGIDVTHVPYKGTPEAIADTIAGRVCCYWAPINAALPHVNGGKARGARGVERAALEPAAERADGRRAGRAGLRLHALGRPVGPGRRCPPTSSTRSTRT